MEPCCVSGSASWTLYTCDQIYLCVTSWFIVFVLVMCLMFLDIIDNLKIWNNLFVNASYV